MRWLLAQRIVMPLMGGGVSGREVMRVTRGGQVVGGRSMLRAVTVVGATLALGAGGIAQVDISNLGPQVGDKALEFRLTDQFGREQTLESVAGPQGTMLVFFRSADW